MQPTAVCQSLSHRRTHAEAHAHAHTSAGVAGAPRVFKACTQSGVRVRAGAHVCVSVVLRVCSGCARVRMCVPRLGAFQRSLGCRPPSHCTASFRHPSYLRVQPSALPRTGPRQEKLPPAGRSKPPAWAWRRAISDTARLRNVQAAPKNSLDKVSDIGTCTRTALRLSHARGSRMNERGDGTAASSAVLSAMAFRIFFALPGTNSQARRWLSQSRQKQSSWVRHTEGLAFLWST